MLLTTLLLMLGFSHVFIEPESAGAKDDQTLATCVVAAMSARPTELAIVTSKETSDIRLIVGNHAGLRVHVLGRLVRPDGSTLVEVDHITHGFNHSLCHQADGLLDEMARKLSKKP